MKQQFLYKLNLVPFLYDEKNWTEVENRIVGEHFSYLKNLSESGIVFLAGKTMVSGEDTFGIVIFNAEDEEIAQTIMEDDPAVKQGVMTAELFPYRVALYNPEAII